MSDASLNTRKIIPTGASRREIAYGILGAGAVIALVGFAILQVGNSSGKTAISGTVVDRKFVPREETLLSVGSSGVQRGERAGLYYIYVKARDTAEVYSVLLSAEDYQRLKIGDSYSIPKASLVP